MELEVVYRIGLVIEISVIVMFLHDLYDSKLTLNIQTVVLVAMDLILMQAIKDKILPNWCSLLIHVMIGIYCMVEFGGGIVKMMVNMFLYIIFLSGLQLSGTMLLSLTNWHVGIKLLVLNIFILLVCLLLHHYKVWKRLQDYIKRRDIMVGIIFFIGAFLIFGILYAVKKGHGWYNGEFISLVCVVIAMCLLAISWEKYKIKSIEADAELKAYKLYEESYKALITDIRIKQHDFNNQINAIYSQHKTCNTYDELVKQQVEYCKTIVNDNKYYKLLRLSNSMLIGFLYGKFLEADEMGIEVLYDINVKQLECNIPMYVLVSICGNLLNNANEAVAKRDKKIIRFEMSETNTAIIIAVSNPCEYKSTQEIVDMFRKGKSTKGENRGIGLYSIKKLSMEYHYQLQCENLSEDNCNWIRFSINIDKSK